MVLKDIRISKDRIPVQNALWIRPTGGMTFKIYYPRGGDWAEMLVEGTAPSPEPTPDPTPTPEPEPTPTPTPVYVKKLDCDGGKVIAAKCIPLKARPGNKYFFADGRIKFIGKSYHHHGDTGRRNRYREIYTYGFNMNGEKIFGSFNGYIPFLRKDNWDPILVHIRSEEYYNKHKDDKENNRGIQVIVLEGYTIYFDVCSAYTLTCDTTSPNFKIIEGHLRNVAKPKMPEFNSTYKRYVIRLLKYRGSRVRETAKWKYACGVLPSKVPLSLKRQWKLVRSEQDLAEIFRVKAQGITNNMNVFTKTLMIQQIKKNRKSERVIVRRHSKTISGSKGLRQAEFREVNPIK